VALVATVALVVLHPGQFQMDNRFIGRRAVHVSGYCFVSPFSRSGMHFGGGSIHNSVGGLDWHVLTLGLDRARQGNDTKHCGIGKVGATVFVTFVEGSLQQAVT
jgi:hypothetical protein